MLVGYILVDEVPISFRMQQDKAWKVWPFHLQSLIWEICVSSSPVQLCTPLLMWVPWLNLAQPAPCAHRISTGTSALLCTANCYNSAGLSRLRTGQNHQQQRYRGVDDGYTQLHSTKTPHYLNTWGPPCWFASVVRVLSFFHLYEQMYLYSFKDRPLVATKDMLAQNRSVQ